MEITVELVAKFAIVIAYFVVMIVLGIKSKKETKSVGDYVTGSQSISPLKTAFSYAMTNFSAGIFIGFAGTGGWNYGIWMIVIGIAASTFLGTYLPWKILAKKVREETQGMHDVTIPGYLEKRYGMNKVRIYTSVLMFIFFIPYSASLLMGMSFLFEQVFGINYTLINIIMAVVTAFYLFLGGFVAMTRTAFFQGIITIVVSVVVLVFVLAMPQVQGPITGFFNLQAIDSSLIIPDTGAKWLGIICLIFATGLGPWGMPDMLQRFIGLDDAKSIKKTTRYTVTISVIIALAASTIGACAHLFFTELPSFAGKTGVDLIVPMIIAQLPSILGALFVVLIMATSMSTLAGLAITASSSFALDFIKPVFKKDMSEKATMTLLRVMSVIFLALALLISLDPPSVMLDLIQVTVAAVAGTFLAPLLWGLYSKKISKAGVIAGMAVGIIITIGGYATLLTGAAWVPADIYAIFKPIGMPFFTIQAILVPVIVVPLVSKFTYKDNANQLESSDTSLSAETAA